MREDIRKLVQALVTLLDMPLLPNIRRIKEEKMINYQTNCSFLFYHGAIVSFCTFTHKASHISHITQTFQGKT